MSYAYDEYLRVHKKNVRDAFEWILKYIPEVFVNDKNDDYGYQISFAHDASKSSMEEYDAYDHYFYGNNRSHAVVHEFKLAWLHHIHNNPHHWQYWILVNDDPNLGMEILDIPENYIIEMVCDWWSFGWKNEDLMSLFSWYAEHEPYMKLSIRTKQKVEGLLDKIRTKLNSEATAVTEGGSE